jgi:hypothetical protein
MLTDAAAQAILALAPDAIMLAYAGPPHSLHLLFPALVGAYAGPQALLALAPDAVILAYAIRRFPCTCSSCACGHVPYPVRNGLANFMGSNASSFHKELPLSASVAN